MYLVFENWRSSELNCNISLFKHEIVEAINYIASATLTRDKLREQCVVIYN